MTSNHSAHVHEHTADEVMIIHALLNQSEERDSIEGEGGQEVRGGGQVVRGEGFQEDEREGRVGPGRGG